MGITSLVQSVGRKGGGDEMVVLRVYSLNGYQVCDLMCPVTSATFSRAPVIYGLGAAIDAPADPWPENGVAWADLPRVAVLYFSSQTQAARSPVVLGVINTGYASTQVRQQGPQAQQSQQPQQGPPGLQNKTVNESLSRAPLPGASDASLMAAGAKVIARADGNLDCVVTNDFVVRSARTLLYNSVQPLKAPAIAEELVTALEPLYDAVNKILEFVSLFPSRQDLTEAAQTAPEAVGSTVVPIDFSMKYSVAGAATNLATGATTPITLDVSHAYSPYEGPEKVSYPNPEDFDSPKILISPRD